jgi:hypothetical protein
MNWLSASMNLLIHYLTGPGELVERVSVSRLTGSV